MKKIIAIPSLDDKGLESEISSHFGHCDLYTLITIEDNKITGVKIIPNLPHGQGGCLAPVQYLKDNNVDILIASGMGMRPLMHFNDVKIKTLHCGESQNVKNAIDLFLNNKLLDFDMNHTCGGSNH